jgi:VIT1/CCC1 family predicted Fe2+/Mn2+ transporter
MSVGMAQFPREGCVRSLTWLPTVRGVSVGISPGSMMVEDESQITPSGGGSVRPPAGAAPRAHAAGMTGAAPGRSLPESEPLADGTDDGSIVHREPLPARSARAGLDHRAEVAQARRELEAIRRHHGSTGRSGSLRAAVFGINDGLVSNFSLVLGMAGASVDSHIVILAGVAGLVSGAGSMAAGEYVSMRVQREVFEGALNMERRELVEEPDAELREVEVILRAQGVPAEDAARIAPRVMEDPELALDLMARQELGLDPDELGSPYGAAASSFVSFAAGALIPLLPFVLLAFGVALAVSVALSGLSLFGVGALAARLSDRPTLFGGARMLLIGAAAAAVTYGIGTLFGVTLAG